MELYSDEYFMNEALKEAHKAFDADEVPVGAVIVANNKIIARAHNYTERLNDVTAHAGCLALASTGQAGRSGGRDQVQAIHGDSSKGWWCQQLIAAAMNPLQLPRAAVLS